MLRNCSKRMVCVCVYECLRQVLGYILTLLQLIQFMSNAYYEIGNIFIIFIILNI